MFDGLKKMLKGWLEISDAPNATINIQEKLNFDTNCIKNHIWMRGDPFEIEQFYKQIYNQDAMFWGSVPYVKIRKIHMGIPQLMVEKLTSIVVNDFNGIELASRENEWEEISKDNIFDAVLENAINKALFLGDGAFRISFDTKVSQYPIIEFKGADEVNLIYERGRFKEAVFKIIHTHDKKKYLLCETYGFGYIKYKLYDARNNKEVPMNTIPDTANLVDVSFGGYVEDSEGNVVHKGSFCMAVPFKVFESNKWVNRGKSIFDTKEGAFDALDEVVSQWMDAIRNARTNKYIPKSLLPRDKNGYVLNPNDFDNRFIATEADMSENAKNEIKVVQPTVPSDNYLQSYISALDASLQGIISPSTLGIDVKKLDNAEAQREKEKTTLYTRGKIIEALQTTLPILVNSVFFAYDTYLKKNLSEYLEVTINFGEYANPSFEATVETISKAKQGGIMSVEAAIDELYGDSKDEDWKREEVARLKKEQGIESLDEPSLVDDLKGGPAYESIN